MQIVLRTPSRNVHRTGNRCTARQWADLLAELGHEVTISEPDSEPETPVNSDFLIALHGERSHEMITHFRATHPRGKLVVAMTGTDIYPEPNENVRESIALADRIVVLQDKATEKIPSKDRSKVRVIFQSARPFEGVTGKSTRHFDVCVVGHLRKVKDPMQAALASRVLPPESRIRIRHAGGILDETYESQVAREEKENPRYHWLGELDELEVAKLIASSHAMVMSSFSEGGARVVGEAIVNGTPVLSSYIDGVRGLLGDHYPGYFPPGDTEVLAALMLKAENDTAYLEELTSQVGAAAPRFRPDQEKEAWRSLIAELVE